MESLEAVALEVMRLDLKCQALLSSDKLRVEH